MRDKILIVDDVEINRDILAEILREEYEILMAESGLQALDILEKVHCLIWSCRNWLVLRCLRN